MASLHPIIVANNGGTFHVTQPTAIEITQNGAPPVTVDVAGVQPLAITGGWGDSADINLAAHSEWVGGIFLEPQLGVTVQGPGVWDNTGSTVHGPAVIKSPVIGTGNFAIVGAHTRDARLEFARSVGAGQSVSVSGYALYGGEHGILQVDNPATFHAAVQLGFGEVILEGLHATRYSLTNDLLSMFNNGRLVDTLRFSLGTQDGMTPLGVSQVGGSVVIHTDGALYAADVGGSGSALGGRVLVG
jgi:hypothetical protein